MNKFYYRQILFFTMHVHIATVGERVEPIINVIKAIPNIDVIYLLYTDRVEKYAQEIHD